MVKTPKILPPIYFFAALLAMGGLHFFFPIAKLLAPPLTYAGALLVAAGAASTLWAAMSFGKAGTPRKPFAPSTVLVTGGLYRFTRNPMYLGLIVALIGAAILFGTASPFTIIPIFVWHIRHRFVLREETFLENIFGRDYLAYKDRVRRWL